MKKLFLSAAALAAAVVSAAELENVALHKPYTFEPREPFYSHCTDPEDKIQLTDGEYVKGYFWVQKGCVGWMSYGAPPYAVTVDLGKDTPICGFSWNTAFGTAGVEFPQVLHVYVSLDGKNWCFAGDLLGRATTLRIMPPPNVYNTYRAWADDMPCHGRYVKFVVQQQLCTFVDEIEVYKGPDELLKQPMPAISTTEPLMFGRTVRLRSRILNDAKRTGVESRKDVLDGIAALDVDKLPQDFKTLIPLFPVHRTIIAANAAKLRSAGFTKPTLWQNCHWDNLDYLAIPTKDQLEAKPVHIASMRGEMRTGAFNIANPTDRELDCKVTVAGFGKDTPIELREVLFTDTSAFRPVSGALKAGAKPGELAFKIPAGMSKQVWIRSVAPTGKASLRRGKVVAKLSNGTTLAQPLEVQVYGLDFPKEPRCHAGGWDYNHAYGWGNTPSNRTANVAMLSELHVDTPWGCCAPGGAKFDTEGNLTSELDLTTWREWTDKTFPNARNYAVFMNTGKKFYGEEVTTERGQKMLKQYFKAWLDGARKCGLKDSQRILILTIDEPAKVEQAELSILWMRAIKSVGSRQLGVYADPIFNEETQPKVPAEFWDLCDVICPHYASPWFAEKMVELAKTGTELWFYSAFGPSRTQDPARYYRMQPWSVFAFGGCGTFFWQLAGGNSFTAYRHKGGEYVPYFVWPSGAMPAKQSEAIRESVQDFEYLSLYAEKVGRDKAAAMAKKMAAKLTANDPDWDRDYDRSLPDLACERMLRELTAAETEYERCFAELEAADNAADAAWDAVADKGQFEQRRAALREKFLAAVGAFPERTPLNAKVVATVSREGYRVEKVLFESRPNFHVTALAFVPDAIRFAPPHPAVLVTCGHSANGKANAGYQRACVMGAREGFLMMICDPIDQGERIMSTDGFCCSGHNQFGAKAHALGLSAAHFRIWDGMRCLDYLESRPDVRGDRLGLMGNSGGGTMTALIAAADPRVRAACPSCYITTIRDVVRSIGPQDAEQCLWGQLKDGVNHASLVLMADAAVRLQFSDKDFFPIAGARSTFDVVKRTADRVGIGERYSATVVKGPHGWKESSRRSSLDWMRQWLMGEKPNGKTDADYVALDATYDAKKADCGLSESEARVAPGGSVLNLSGERTVSDVLVDRAIGARTPRLVFRETVPTRHSFYGAKSAAEENAVIALMLGKNLVEEREREILAKARAVAARGEPKPVLVAEDDWMRPAERAYAEAPELFAGFYALGDGTFRTSVRSSTSTQN